MQSICLFLIFRKAVYGLIILRSVWFFTGLELEENVWTNFKGVYSVCVRIHTDTDSDIHEHIHGTMEDLPNCKLKVFLSSQWFCFKVSSDEQDPVRIGTHYGGSKCGKYFTFLQEKEEFISIPYILSDI